MQSFNAYMEAECSILRDGIMAFDLIDAWLAALRAELELREAQLEDMRAADAAAKRHARAHLQVVK